MTTKKTSAAYTPGPWGFIAEPWLFGGTPTVAAEAGKGLILTTITHVGKGDYPGQLGDPRADARLMAAAPELLQQLKNLLEDLRGAKELMLSSCESDSWMVTAAGWDSLIHATERVIDKTYGNAA